MKIEFKFHAKEKSSLLKVNWIFFPLLQHSNRRRFNRNTNFHEFNIFFSFSLKYHTNCYGTMLKMFAYKFEQWFTILFMVVDVAVTIHKLAWFSNEIPSNNQIKFNWKLICMALVCIKNPRIFEFDCMCAANFIENHFQMDGSLEKYYGSKFVACKIKVH